MTSAGLRNHFAKIPRSPIAIEAPPQCRWVAKTLGEFGHEVIVANHRKKDCNDAKLLARLTRVDESKTKETRL